MNRKLKENFILYYTPINLSYIYTDLESVEFLLVYLHVTNKVSNNYCLYYPTKLETLVRNEYPITLDMVLMRTKREGFRGPSAYTRWNQPDGKKKKKKYIIALE